MTLRFVVFIVALFTLSVSFGQPSTGIKEAQYVSLGGIHQWITLNGDNTKASLLLIIHGGPGDAQSSLSQFYRAYERDFLVVQWDQRGAGKTFQKYKEQTPAMTLEQLISDGVELAEYLKKKFPENKIIVLGHSWGTAIATGMVQQRPDLFAAYVGTGQIASWKASVHWQFDFLRKKAKNTGDEKLEAELEKIGEPDPDDTEQYFGFNHHLRKFFGKADATWLQGLRTLAAEMPKDELENIMGGMNYSGQSFLPFQKQIRLSSTSLHFEIPYFVIQGQEDLFTPTEPVLLYFDNIRAPEKKIVILETAGHFALVTHPERFREELLRMIRP